MTSHDRPASSPRPLAGEADAHSAAGEGVAVTLQGPHPACFARRPLPQAGEVFLYGAGKPPS